MWHSPSWDATIMKCKLYDRQMNLPSSSRVFMRLFLSSSTVEFFPFHHCQRNLPAVMYAKNQNDRERTRFFHIFPPELRISPEETLTALPFPDIFSIASRCNRSISLHARRRRPVVSATTIRELICSLQRHYVKRSFFRYT